MDYNLVGLRQRVRIDKLDDEEFDSGVIDNFINDTQRDIFNEYELPFQEKIFQVRFLLALRCSNPQMTLHNYNLRLWLMYQVSQTTK